MAELNTNHAARQHLYILEKHVLGPLSAAEAIAERERTEVAAERDAFERFAERVAELSPVTVDRQPVPLGKGLNESTDKRTSELRRAYEETVMSVPHYDDVYGETLEENVTVEFGAEVAELFRPSSAVPFSPQHRDLIVGAAKQGARERANFCEAVDAEIDSVQSTHGKLSELLDTLDNSIVPAWHREEFVARVDEIQAARQAALFSRSLPSGYDGHTLCGYLYGDEPWTYPGLTAVTRLLDSVVLQEEPREGV